MLRIRMCSFRLFLAFISNPLLSSLHPPPPLFKGWNITTSSSWSILLKRRKSTSCSLSCEYRRKHSRGIDWNVLHSLKPPAPWKKRKRNGALSPALWWSFSILSSTSDACFSSIQCHRQGGVRLDPGSRILLREGHQQCDAAGVGGCSLPPLPQNRPQKS